MTFLTSPGKTYSIYSVAGCTVSADGSVVVTVEPGKQIAFVAPGEEISVSDPDAIIVEVTGIGADLTAAGAGGAAAPSLKFEVVDVLPETGEDGIIYLVPTGETGDNKYEEWVWVNGSYEQMGTASLDLSGFAVLEGGNTFTGDQIINGDLTITGDVTTEGEYIGAEVIETSDTTITPETGKYYKYTGTGDTITVVAPTWYGYMTISYLETATPVDLQGVTWSPAKPSLTGAGPFVYTLVHAGSGSVLASAMNYSVATAEAIQEVVPIKWTHTTHRAMVANEVDAIALGNGANALGGWDIAIGANANTQGIYSIAIGGGASAKGNCGISMNGHTTGAYSINFGGFTKKDRAITVGYAFTETVDGTNVTHTCTTEGTGSITIGAGANTLNTTTTVNGVETTVESSNAVTIGCKASNTGADSVVIGAQASSLYFGGVAIGAQASADFQHSISVGNRSSSANVATVSLGYAAKSTFHSDVAVGNQATASGTSSVAIGKQASASAPNTVVLGTGASSAGSSGVALGESSKVTSNGGIAIGQSSIAWLYATAIGIHAEATQQQSVALGNNAKAKGTFATAIGQNANAANYGVVVLSSVAPDATKTQLYLAGAGTDLANTYENGEAMMGYVVRDSAGNVMTDAEGNAMVGTQKLSVLFPNNRGENAFTPSALNLDDEYTPKPMFHPADLDLPVEEETTEEPEDITTNIPETTLPEPEEYTPLPIYPIVEPDIPSEV